MNLKTIILGVIMAFTLVSQVSAIKCILEGCGGEARQWRSRPVDFPEKGPCLDDEVGGQCLKQRSKLYYVCMRCNSVIGKNNQMPHLEEGCAHESKYIHTKGKIPPNDSDGSSASTSKAKPTSSTTPSGLPFYDLGQQTTNPSGLPFYDFFKKK
ncbi:hypothetical protein PGT21_014832 [Puccinia graminis f. sp. tritici]|uniref:C2H2-type domain-containing protein n=1 Tax=Puccinia graminis f. sp. tritici TaxID=56615 RepID=A0A5B0PBB1_PUCGR|nr:hypothetical protein PGTUg99_017850 [Puccinia graminis f. sp. tritici]KAA1105665.1 hypothetical protein PGT21_014832 [Puccinia graminis f. sp. tritici]